MKPAQRTLVMFAVLVFVCMFNLTLIVPSVKELIIDRFDASATEASLFVTVEMVAYIVFGMVWGALSDRRGERRVFVVMGFLGSAVLYYTMSLAPSLATLLFVRFCQGAMTVMAWSLIMTLVLDMTDRRQYGASMGVVGTGLALGLGLGAPIGGILGETDVLLPLYAASGLFVICTAVALVVVKDVPITHKPESILRALAIAATDRRALPPYLFSFAERFSAGFLVLLFPLYLADQFGSSPGERGMYLAAFLIPFAIMQYPFGRVSDVRGRRTMLVVGGFAYASLFAAIGLLDKSSAAVVMVACGVLAAMLLPASLALLGDIAPRGEHASFMGGFNAFGSLGFAAGPLLAATLSDSADYGAAFILGGLTVLSAILISIPLLLRMELPEDRVYAKPRPALRRLLGRRR